MTPAVAALATVEEANAYLDDLIARRREGRTLAEEADALSLSLRRFVYAAWPYLGYPKPPQTFHIDAICDHVQAAYERDITRLLVTIQPGAFKSTIVSVLAPAWRWLTYPQERLVTASHGDDLATRDTTNSRTLMQSAWYQAVLRALGQEWTFTEAQNLKTRYTNTKGGQRVRTHVGGGTGDRGSILQLDDPHNAREARYVDTQLQDAVQWWGDTAVSRLDDTIEHPGSMIVIGQRIHEKDLIGYLIASGRWTHLCLPTRYERKHPFVYPAKVKLATRTIQGDPRKREGELLMPKLQDEGKLADKVAEDGVTAHVFVGQYQQRPSAREGKILLRKGWRFYDRDISFYRERASFTPELVAKLTANGRLPRFGRIVHSWDTSVKDRAHSDFVSGQIWGCPKDRDADRWLLRLWHERAGLNATIDAMLMMSAWGRDLWPDVPQFVVIETAANGADAIAEIKGRVQGVVPWPQKGAAAAGDKRARAEAASPALDGANCYLPGYANETGDDYDPRTPLAVQAFVEELSEFDSGSHDDQVDAWSQMVNYSRRPFRRKGRVSIPRGVVPSPAGMPGR